MNQIKNMILQEIKSILKLKINLKRKNKQKKKENQKKDDIFYISKVCFKLYFIYQPKLIINGFLLSVK